MLEHPDRGAGMYGVGLANLIMITLSPLILRERDREREGGVHHSVHTGVILCSEEHFNISVHLGLQLMYVESLCK